ncbi:ABC transporter ATP-binding protein [Desulfovibrio psychrotolerans]|uniref:Phosphate ABC transporter ATP-binding protein n=1 Tax=Desulfovibrio psychrotolerans TaxID=415242 RepID=A0A7J0BQA2_9BACT|nr:phosphate ABC transporter ATP-binding protein [Desulfovibrio psychrotolerans]GFM35818.1 phosphate ABC transporter ATP-binding protein [Desulfovibrio psychrotolerans]
MISPDHFPSIVSSAARLADVSVFFGNAKVLHDITLNVPAQGATVLVGRSGSGKTTLLRVFNRLNECLPGSRTAGCATLRLDGRDMDIYGSAFSDPSRLRVRVGMVFQSPDVLPLSIRRNMELPLRHALGLSQASITPRMEEALKEAALWDEVAHRLDTPAETLSGGQQQRLCLARCLAMRPDLLLLDEPTASLDNVASRTIESLLVTLKQRIPVIMVSHSLGQSLRLADRLVLMSAGRIRQCWDRAHGLPDIAQLESLLEAAQEEDACCR